MTNTIPQSIIDQINEKYPQVIGNAWQHNANVQREAAEVGYRLAVLHSDQEVAAGDNGASQVKPNHGTELLAQNQTLSPEEVLDKHYNQNLGFLSITYEQVLAAMIEYHQQFK